MNRKEIASKSKWANKEEPNLALHINSLVLILNMKGFRELINVPEERHNQA